MSHLKYKKGNDITVDAAIHYSHPSLIESGPDLHNITKCKTLVSFISAS